MADAAAIGQPSALTGAEEPPRRLHPLGLLLRLLLALPQLIFAYIAIGFSKGLSSVPEFVPALIALACIAILGMGWLAWRRFSYRLGEDELRIESGILSRNARSIPYARIQDVNIEQKPLSRLLGLALVRLETGSGGGEDGELRYVSLDEAERLREQIRRRKSGVILASTAPDAEAGASPQEQEGHLVFAMDLRRVLTAGLFNFSLAILAVIGAAIQNLDFLIPDTFFDPRRWIAVMSGQQWLLQLGVWSQILGFVALLVSLVIIGIFTGVLRTLLRDYGFRLERTETGFRRRRGLLTLTDVSLPLKRIQAAMIVTGPVRRALGWWSLKFQSLARDGKNETNHLAATLARRDEIDAILAEPGIPWAVNDGDMLRIDPAYWRIPPLLIAPFVLLGALLGTTYGDGRLILLVLLIPLVALILFLGWRYCRYALDHGQLYVRQGFWQQRLTILPLAKVQSVDLKSGPVDRLLGLCNVVMGVAGGSGISPLTIHCMKQADALALREDLLGRG
ncbi:MAG: PH domain-containing protein [Blastomonas sp.]